MAVGVDDDLGRPEWCLEGRKAVVEDGDLEARKGDLARLAAGAGGVQRTVVARGKERALLAVDRVDDLLAAQLLEAQLAHGDSGSRVYSRSARPSSLTCLATTTGP